MEGKTILIKLKTGDIVPIEIIKIDFIKPRLFECEIHMIDGTVYMIWEDFSDFKNRIKNL